MVLGEGVSDGDREEERKGDEEGVSVPATEVLPLLLPLAE